MQSLRCFSAAQVWASFGGVLLAGCASPSGSDLSAGSRAAFGARVDPLSEAWTAVGDLERANFGRSVASAGDVNGDGFDDVIVGCPADTHFPALDVGRAQVFLGSAAGPATRPAWTVDAGEPGDNFGFSVASAGDVNGDGFDDVIVGAIKHGGSDAGAVFAYLGSPTGLSTVPAWTAHGDHPGSWFGFSVAAAGDVDGDGFDDVIIGDPHDRDGEAFEGRALVYLGSAAGLPSDAAWIVHGDREEAELGISVAGAGDVNGDGYDDIVVGASGLGELAGGAVLLYSGSPDGPTGVPAWTAQSDQPDASFGTSIASAGDVDGDGYDDIIVGAPRYGADVPLEGLAAVYLGAATGPAAAPAWTIASGEVGALLGGSVGGAGDVDGDGYDDVLVSAIQFAGDPYAVGRAYLYRGSAAALETSPGWTSEGSQSFELFGNSVASGGDVNGDGFADVLVGAPQFSVGGHLGGDEGRALLYLGSISTDEHDSDDSGCTTAGECGSDSDDDGSPERIVGACATGGVSPSLFATMLATAAGWSRRRRHDEDRSPARSATPRRH